MFFSQSTNNWYYLYGMHLQIKVLKTLNIEHCLLLFPEKIKLHRHELKTQGKT